MDTINQTELSGTFDH